MLVKLVHGMHSQMREEDTSCKWLEEKSMEHAVLQDTLRAKVIKVQNVRKKSENSVMRQSIKGPKYRDK